VDFQELPIAGAYVIDPHLIRDERGYFGRVFCEDTFRANGLEFRTLQVNVAYSHRAGTVRGIHYQTDAAPEAKLIWCIHGAMFDVVVDLRTDSPTFLQWHAVELSHENRRMLLIPPLCGHGYQPLVDDVEMSYLASAPYAPDAATGVRYDDPALGIQWPSPVSVISERDRTWPPVGGLRRSGT